jgi:hypothetical protein
LLIQELIEKLSALEHDQWIQYSRSIYRQIKQSTSREDLLKRGADKGQSKWKPYDLLSESEKDKDRIWANKVLEIIRSNEQYMTALSHKTGTIRENSGLPNVYPSMLYLLNLESREQLDLEHQELLIRRC